MKYSLGTATFGLVTMIASFAFVHNQEVGSTVFFSGIGFFVLGILWAFLIGWRSSRLQSARLENGSESI